MKLKYTHQTETVTFDIEEENIREETLGKVPKSSFGERRQLGCLLKLFA